MGDWAPGSYDTPGAANACSTAVILASQTASGELPGTGAPMGLGLLAVLAGSSYLAWRRRR